MRIADSQEMFGRDISEYGEVVQIRRSDPDTVTICINGHCGDFTVEEAMRIRTAINRVVSNN